ncbi:MAG: TetR/AcrR family transcriptional regulator [Lysinibacillus sp.]
MARERKFSTTDIFNETKQLLLDNGYERYNIGQLAEKLNVSRAAIYKYYTNKDELIVDFMLHEMDLMIEEFNNIDSTASFDEQLNGVLNTIFDSKDLHQILAFAHMIEAKDNTSIANKLETLNSLHLEMYKPLMRLIAKGKQDELIHQDLSESVMISFIFQSIQIPNHMNEPKETFLNSLRKLILNGLYTHK